jgi:hypothetical protein
MPQPKLTLSRAILIGCPLVPATKHLTFRFECSGKDWAAHQAHRFPIVGADALGAALVGLVGDAAKAVERSFEGPDGSPLAVLERLYPALLEERTGCPSPGCTVFAKNTGLRLLSVICHVQDAHGWSRQQVASFLNEQGL